MKDKTDILDGIEVIETKAAFLACAVSCIYKFEDLPADAIRGLGVYMTELLMTITRLHEKIRKSA